MASPNPPRHLVLSALLLVQVLFGINYVASKVVVDAFPPLLWGSIRLIISAVVMLCLAAFLRRPHPRGGVRFFGPLVGYALIGIILNQASFLVGLRYTTPTNSAILNTLTPIFALLIITLRGQEKFNLRKGLGFLSAFGGVLVLRRVEEFRFSDTTAVGDLLIILNCVSFSLFLSLSKKFMETHDQFWVTTWMFIYGSFGISAMAIPDWSQLQLPPMTPDLWLCMTFSIIGGTLLTYFLNNWALKHTHSSNVALFIYIQPAIAITLSWFWFGEPITIRAMLSCVLIFIGLFLALAGKNTSGKAHLAETRPA